MISQRTPRPGTRWTCEAVVEGIRRRQAEGLALHLEAVKRTNGALAYGGKACFENWSDALRAAGLDPDEIRYGAKWSRRKVIRAILEWQAQGKSLCWSSVRRVCPSMTTAAVYHWGRWSSALKAAGIDPEQCRAFRTWSQADVVDSIRKDARAGLALNATAVLRRNRFLVSAARRDFGCWDDALRATGLDPTAHRRHRAPFTREDVIRIIHRRRDEGKPSNLNGIKPKSIPHAAIRIFGSWDDALRAAGLDPTDVRKANPYYTAEEIIGAIRERARAREPLDATATREAKPRLYRSARMIFGGWPEALNEAGVDASRIERKKTKWTRLTIMECLLWRSEKGLPLNTTRIIQEIPYPAIKREFGSYPNALRAAGIDPEKVYLAKRWTRQAILSGIRSRKGAGRLLNVQAVHQEEPRLLGAARRHFGKWAAALTEAGIDPAKHQIDQSYWTREKVIACLRGQVREGRRLSCGQVRPRSLYKVSVRLFGSWRAAVDESMKAS